MHRLRLPQAFCQAPKFLATFIAKPGQSVLLSPASASFDGFANYEERGKAFKEIVDGINEENI